MLLTASGDQTVYLKGSLSDNTVAPRQRYRVTVKTGNAPRAGTDADDYPTIHDRDGRVLPKVLLDGQGDRFEAGQTDQFTLMLPVLREIARIEIGHNNNPRTTPRNAEWHLLAVTIQRVGRPNERWDFVVDKVLAATTSSWQDVTTTATPLRSSRPAPGRPNLPPR